MHKLTELIQQDMKPALGVTEPGAIAFAVASAKKYVNGEIDQVKVALNSGMYKNAYTCGIPNSTEYGNLYAAALGAAGADESLGLESLAHITDEDNEKARELVEGGKVEVVLDHIGSEITIEANVKSKEDSCTVKIQGSHTDIRTIEKNGIIIYRKPETSLRDKGEKSLGKMGEEDARRDPVNAGSDAEFEKDKEQAALIHRYTLEDILQYVRTISTEEISFIRDAFSMNMELLEEGIESERTTIGPMLLEQNSHKIISEDAKKTAQLLCNGAIEARVLGLSKPAMSITGSGAHGIIATMPLFAYYEVNYEVVDDDILLRATALSYLITMYIKEYSGRLSAFCGCGIAAGTGMACGLAYMRGASEEQIIWVIQNMASGLTGMICDGGNQGCAMKGIVAVDAAFRSVDMAMSGVKIESIHGINGRTPEDTMRNMGLIASPGMVKTEEVIVNIMQGK